MIPEIHIEDFSYDLPDERIAKYPLAQRDSSKLLIYKEGECRESVFNHLPENLPENAIMVFNDTKVVPARMFFKRDTGAVIEIFCLEPVEPSEYVSAFASTAVCRWKAVIGNSKRWKDDVLSYDIEEAFAGKDADELRKVDLKAKLISRDGQTGVVEFSWKSGIPFSNVLDLCGKMPIPPYLNRDTENIDLERYQTTYARVRGSVAAPTAGLHFTDRTMSDIQSKGIDIQKVCLHVGAGTFLPVKTSLVSEHPMHREPFVVKASFLKDILNGERKLIAVGTTSVRTLESLYYVGVSIIENGKPEDVEQWAPYTRTYNYSLKESISAILKYLENNGLEELKVGTRIIILPGFQFRLVDILVTNFHQPQSTLLLLVSAFVNGDWHNIYDFALGNGFRFLSYGDSSVLFRTERF